MSTSSATPYGWRFFRAGGFDQVCIDSGADLLALDQLDQKLWGALSCPVRGIEFDPRTLAFLDSDNDGHIRAPEVIAAAQWAAGLLRDPDMLTQRIDTLPLSAINTEKEEGQVILAAAKHILRVENDENAETISAQNLADAWTQVAAMRLNGDGIVPPESADDDDLKAAIEDIIHCCGSEPDRSGEGGISAKIAESFFTQAQAWADWQAQAENNAEIRFLGANTLAASEAFRAVRAKVDDYFTRCRLAAYDPRAAEALNRSLEDYQKLAAQDLAGAAADMAAFPLAMVAAHAPLPLADALNPAWEQAMRALREQVVALLFGDKQTLTQQEWETLAAKFAKLDDWLAQKPAFTAPGSATQTIEQLGIDRIRALLGNGTPEKIAALIAQDAALKPETDAMDALDKLLHYCRDLHTLIDNFVSFRDFYTRRGKATFQVGTLYMDGRSCELCVRVENVDKHALLANLSRMCLAYCECARGAERMFIAAAFTGGDSDQLVAGRNGVFYDRQGRDWDATIVRMLDHPISIRQSFWMPYKRAAKMIGEQVQKLTAARSQARETQLVATAMDTANSGKLPEPKPPFDSAKFAGMLAAAGLAVGVLGAALASVMNGLLGLKWWQFPILIIGLLLLVSGPAMLIAWLKLRQRNLGPMLDANGWAVNARVKINIPFGASLTAVAQLPKGANRSLADPYAEKKTVWPYWVLLLAILIGAAWYYLKWPLP